MAQLCGNYGQAHGAGGSLWESFPQEPVYARPHCALSSVGAAKQSVVSAGAVMDPATRQPGWWSAVPPAAELSSPLPRLLQLQTKRDRGDCRARMSLDGVDG